VNSGHIVAQLLEKQRPTSRYNSTSSEAMEDKELQSRPAF
jgi:hypothetical protein